VLVALRRGQKKQEHLFQPCDRWQVQVKMLNGISSLFYDWFYWFYYVHHIIALATVSFPRHAAMLSYSRRFIYCFYSTVSFSLHYVYGVADVRSSLCFSFCLLYWAQR
jgi:hypothetical protein